MDDAIAISWLGATCPARRCAQLSGITGLLQRRRWLSLLVLLTSLGVASQLVAQPPPSRPANVTAPASPFEVSQQSRGYQTLGRQPHDPQSLEGTVPSAEGLRPSSRGVRFVAGETSQRWLQLTALGAQGRQSDALEILLELWEEHGDDLLAAPSGHADYQRWLPLRRHLASQLLAPTVEPGAAPSSGSTLAPVAPESTANRSPSTSNGAGESVAGDQATRDDNAAVRDRPGRAAAGDTDNFEGAAATTAAEAGKETWQTALVRAYRERGDELLGARYQRAVTQRQVPELTELALDELLSAWSGPSLLALGDIELSSGEVSAADFWWGMLAVRQGAGTAFLGNGRAKFEPTPTNSDLLTSPRYELGGPVADIGLADIEARQIYALLVRGEFQLARAALADFQRAHADVAGVVWGESRPWSRWLRAELAERTAAPPTPAQEDSRHWPSRLLWKFSLDSHQLTSYTDKSSAADPQAGEPPSNTVDLENSSRTTRGGVDEEHERRDGRLPPSPTPVPGSFDSATSPMPPADFVGLLTPTPRPPARALSNSPRIYPRVWRDLLLIPDTEGFTALELATGQPRFSSHPLRAEPAESLSPSSQPPHLEVVGHQALLMVDVPGRFSDEQPWQSRLMVCDLLAEGRLMFAWEPPLADERFVSRPVASGNRCWIVSSPSPTLAACSVNCYSLVTGQLVWRCSLAEILGRTGVSATNSVDATSLGALSGEEMARRQLNLVMSGPLLILAGPTGELVAVRAQDGRVTWALQPTIVDKTTATDETPSDGKPLRERADLDGWYRNVLAVGNVITFSPSPAGSGEVIAVDAMTGIIRWRSSAAPAAGGVQDFVGVRAGRLLLAGNRQWQLDLPTGQLSQSRIDNPFPLDRAAAWRPAGLSWAEKHAWYWSWVREADGSNWLFGLDLSTDEWVRPPLSLSQLDIPAGHLQRVGPFWIVASADTISVLQDVD